MKEIELGRFQGKGLWLFGHRNAVEALEFNPFSVVWAQQCECPVVGFACLILSSLLVQCGGFSPAINQDLSDGPPKITHQVETLPIGLITLAPPRSTSRRRSGSVQGFGNMCSLWCWYWRWRCCRCCCCCCSGGGGGSCWWY